MSYEDPTPDEEPSSRLAGRMPWILLGIGGLAILAVVGAIVAMRRGNDQVNVSVANQATSTPAVVGVPVTVVVTPTSGPPTLVIPTPTREVVTMVVTAEPKAPPAAAVAAPPSAPGNGSQAGAQANPTPTRPATAAAPATATMPPKPTAQPFRGEVSPSGGLANSRTSFEGAYGAPTGETPSGLVVYQRAPREFQVLFSPDPVRAILVAARTLPGMATLSLDQARDVAHGILPNDAQRPTAQPEGNQQFVVERYHSNTLAQALPDDLAREWGGQAGDLVAIFQRSASDPGHIDRVIVAIGDNIDRARQRAG
jgi:hypothetical protein